jgi:hypothetical protein
MALQRWPRPGRYLPSRSSPRIIIRGLPSHEIRPPSESRRAALPPLRHGATPSLRVSVPCGAISMGSLLRVPCRTLPTEFCLLRSVPPSGFLNLLTAYSSQCLVALFHATGTRWVLPSELCSLPGAVPPLDGRCPRVVLRPTPRNIVTWWRSRLQGFALLESPKPTARWLG